MTIQTGQSRRDNPDRTIKTGQSRQDNQDRTIQTQATLDTRHRTKYSTQN